MYYYVLYIYNYIISLNIDTKDEIIIVRIQCFFKKEDLYVYANLLPMR